MLPVEKPMTGTKVSDFVEDLVRYGSNKEVRWFLGKYEIPYEDYKSFYSFAAQPAVNYFNNAKNVKNRLLHLVRVVNREKGNLQSQLLRKNARELQKTINALAQAVKDVTQPWSDGYLNEEEEEEE